jgi:hypothetical protein
MSARLERALELRWGSTANLYNDYGGYYLFSIALGPPGQGRTKHNTPVSSCNLHAKRCIIVSEDFIHIFSDECCNVLH